MHRPVRIVMMVSLFGCAQPGDAARPSVDPPPVAAAADGHRHILDVDWVPLSEAEIHRQARAIVHGRVVEQRSGTHRTYALHPEDGYAELPLTTSFLEVDANEPGATVPVVQLGGRYPDGCWVEPSDQRLLRVGDEVVVFLKPAGMVPIEMEAAAEARSIVGGQQGLIPVRDGIADPIPTTVFARYAGRPVGELEREVERRAISSWEEP